MADERDMREIYARTLLEAGETDDRICVLEADLMKATGTPVFADRFPDRAFNVGVAEANLVGIACGLAAMGKRPYAATFTAFAARKAYDQFFISGNYSGLRVNLIGTDPGITAELNGGTHMCFEDVTMMRAVPELTIIEPCDRRSLEALVRESIDYEGSIYLRLQRRGGLSLYDENETFRIGKGNLVRDGDDVTIVAVGMVLMEEALKAVEMLSAEGISAALIDMHTIKPLDGDLVEQYARKTGAIVSCENAQVMGGLGAAIAEHLSETVPTPLYRIGSRDQFGQVGDLDYLKGTYAMDAASIVSGAKSVIARRRG